MCIARVASRLWIAVPFTVVVALGAIGVVPEAPVSRERVGHRSVAVAAAAHRSPTVREQATQQAALPWQFQVLDQAGGDTGPVLLIGDLAYVGRGPVVAVADVADARRPRWVGQSSVLDGAVTELLFAREGLLALVGQDGYRDGYDEQLVSLSLADPLKPQTVAVLNLGDASLDLAPAADGAWLSAIVRSDLGSELKVMALDLADPARPSVTVKWSSRWGERTWPERTPLLRSLGPGMVAAVGLRPNEAGDSLWVFDDTAGRDLALMNRFDLGPDDVLAMAVDPNQKRVYVATEQSVRILDIAPDGGVRPRGSVQIGARGDCGGLFLVDRRLIAGSGCDGGLTEVIDVADPDQPRLVSSSPVEISLARLAATDTRMVGTGGRQGGLRVLDRTQPSALTTLGRITDPPVYRNVVDTAHGRYGVVSGQGIVRLGGESEPDWAASTLVYDHPAVGSLVVGPDPLLVAVESDAPFETARLRLLRSEVLRLVPVAQSDLEGRWVRRLQSVDDDLYVSQEDSVAGGAPAAPIERWRIGPDTLTRVAKADAGTVPGTCFHAADKVYVSVDDSLLLLDRLSLLLTQTLSGSTLGALNCRLSARQVEGDRPGIELMSIADSFVPFGASTLHAQRVDGLTLRETARLELPWTGFSGDVSIRALPSQVALLGGPGLALLDAPVDGEWSYRALLGLPGALSLTALEAGATSMDPGERWILSTDALGLLLITTAEGSAPTVPPPPPASTTPIGPGPGASGTPALPTPRVLPTPDPLAPWRSVYLPFVGDQNLAAKPARFSDIRSIGPGFAAIAAEGDRAWAGDGLTVVALVWRDGAFHLAARSANLPAALQLLAPGTGHLVGIAGARHLITLSRPDGGAPQLLGQLTLPDHAVDLALRGERAYVATKDSGIVVVDLGRIGKPRIAAVLGIRGTGLAMTVVGDWLIWLGEPEGGTSRLAVADLADADRPRWVSERQVIIDREVVSRARPFVGANSRNVFVQGLAETADGVGVTAFTVQSDGQLVDDLAWMAALTAAPGIWSLPFAVHNLAVTDDWLLVQGVPGVTSVSLTEAGLPLRKARWEQANGWQPGSLRIAGGRSLAVQSGAVNGLLAVGGLVWSDLATLSPGSADQPPTEGELAAFPLETSRMVGSGTQLCVGPYFRGAGPTAWLALDASDPANPRPLGRMALPPFVHWMMLDDPRDALALRAFEDMEPSILRLDATDIIHPRVVSETKLSGGYPAWALRDGAIVGVKLQPQGPGIPMAPVFQFLGAEAGAPLRLLGSIAVPVFSESVDLFLDRDRAYISTGSFSHVPVGDTWLPAEGTAVFDLRSDPPRHLGNLPFATSGIKRIGDTVFAIIDDNSAPIGSDSRYLATVDLAEEPGRSRVLQRLTLSGRIAVMPWSDHPLGDLIQLPDGRLVMPVIAGATAPGSDSHLALEVLRPDGQGGYASEGEGPPFQSTPYGSPSLLNLGDWVAYISGASEANGVLNLARTEP